VQANPYDFDKPVEDPAMFFGRTAEIKEIINGLSSPTGVSFALYGGRRMGKTSLLRQIERRLLERVKTPETPKIIPLYIDLDFKEMHSRKDFFAYAIDELREVITRHLSGVTLDPKLIDRLSRRGEEGPEPQKDFEEAFKYVYDVCFRHMGSIRVVLLIDESERIMAQANLAELRANLRALLSNRPVTRGNLAIVMAGSAKFHTEMEE
jgi:AAA+ ATPase superfamily predicted ATPase